ncbi:MAG: transposase [candidate division Zixibacteria bacterium]|nr:transposase [candidate division Zixibacteria bacterium]
MTQLRHYDNLGTARFVTFSTYRRQPTLIDCRTVTVVLNYLDAARSKHGFRLLGYVVMPEHIHLVLHPPDGMKLGFVIREIKSRSARDVYSHEPNAPKGVRRVFWQFRCYDHNCRSPESVVEKIRYCHNNPVKRGMVASPDEWQWSSWVCYHGAKDVPLVVDVEEWYASVLSN